MKLTEPILELVEKFLSEKNIERSSKDLYRKTLHYYINWLVRKEHPVKEPTKASLIIYIEELKGSSKSIRTIDSYLTSVKMFFKWLKENELYDKNIASGIKSLRKSNDYIRSSLSLEQVTLLLESAKGNKIINSRNLAIINLMCFLGLRRIEVTRLNVGDIYPAESQWYIKLHGKGRHEKDCELPITDNILTPIRDYLDLRIEGISDNSPLFCNHARCSVKRITPDFVSRMIKGYLKRIGLNNKQFTCHSLRHTAATNALRAGSKVAEIQQMLRQRNASTTEIYLRSIRENRINDGSAIFALDEYYSKFKETRQK
jgi:integrase/recombinase XerD